LKDELREVTSVALIGYEGLVEDDESANEVEEDREEMEEWMYIRSSG